MSDKTLQVVEKEVSTLQTQIEKLVIASPEDMAGAAKMLTAINKKADAVEAEKEKVTKPLWAALQAERGRWKPFETTYEALKATLRKKMTEYQTAEVKRAAAEADKIVDRVGEGRGKFTAATAVRKMEEIEKPNKVVAAGEGVVKFTAKPKVTIAPLKQTWLIKEQIGNWKEFEAILENCVLNGLIIWDEIAVRKAVLAAKESKLPGIKYEIEQVPVNLR